MIPRNQHYAMIMAFIAPLVLLVPNAAAQNTGPSPVDTEALPLFRNDPREGLTIIHGQKRIRLDPGGSLTAMNPSDVEDLRHLASHPSLGTARIAEEPMMVWVFTDDDERLEALNALAEYGLNRAREAAIRRVPAATERNGDAQPLIERQLAADGCIVSQALMFEHSAFDSRGYGRWTQLDCSELLEDFTIDMWEGGPGPVTPAMPAGVMHDRVSSVWLTGGPGTFIWILEDELFRGKELLLATFDERSFVEWHLVAPDLRAYCRTSFFFCRSSWNDAADSATMSRCSVTETTTAEEWSRCVGEHLRGVRAFQVTSPLKSRGG
jgi:hypothetical protein